MTSEFQKHAVDYFDLRERIFYSAQSIDEKVKTYLRQHKIKQESNGHCKTAFWLLPKRTENSLCWN